MNPRKLAIALTLVVLVGLVSYRMGWFEKLFNDAGETKAPAAVVPDAGKSGPPTAPSAAPKSGPAATGKGAGGGGPITVEVVAVVKRDISETLSVTGEFRSVESVEIRPEISGKIALIAYKDGQSVAQGALLLALDDRLVRAELAQAQAEADLAASNFRRAQDLFARQFISSRGLDEAQANADIAAARRDLAKARFDRTQLMAPFAGRVGLRQHSVGDYVKEGELVAVLEDSRRMNFDFRVPERFIDQIRPGQPLTIQTDLGVRPMSARVAAVDVRVDPDGRFLQLRAVVENSVGQFKTGMFGRAQLTLFDRPGAVLVSEEALVGDRQGFFVWRVKDGKVEQVRIKTGIRLQKEVEVREGLTPGDAVVVAGQLKIRAPGQPVKAVPAEGL